MSHLLPDGFGRVLPQGQLGRVGQSLLHCQITQQVIALEVKKTKRSRTQTKTREKQTSRSRRRACVWCFSRICFHLFCSSCDKMILWDSASVLHRLHTGVFSMFIYQIYSNISFLPHAQTHTSASSNLLNPLARFN